MKSASTMTSMSPERKVMFDEIAENVSLEEKMAIPYEFPDNGSDLEVKIIVVCFVYHHIFLLPHAYFLGFLKT